MKVADTQIEIETVDISNWSQVVARYANLTNPYHDFENFLLYAEKALQELRFEDIEPIKRFARGHTSHGRMLLTGGLADPDLIPTAEENANIHDHKATFYSEFRLLMVSKMLGEPFSYVQERNGTIIHNMRPRRDSEQQITSDSSRILLDLHNENIYHPVSPDYLLLGGLRRDPSGQARTLVAGVDEVIHLLSPAERLELRQFKYRTSVDFNFGNRNADRGTGPRVRVLYGNETCPMIAFDDEYIVGTDESSQRALDKIRQILHDHMSSIDIGPGEILLLDNLRTVHGRTPFQARYDGSDRWLQRVMVTRDIRRAEILLGNANRQIDWNYNPGEYYGYVDYG